MRRERLAEIPRGVVFQTLFENLESGRHKKCIFFTRLKNRERAAISFTPWGSTKMGLLNHFMIGLVLALFLPGAAKAEVSEGDLSQERTEAVRPAPKRGGDNKSAVVSSGRPENRWRYRYFQERWWYWDTQNRWTYYNGQAWQPYMPTGEYQSVKVDPARLRIEAQEGVSGFRTWRSGGAGGAGVRAGNSAAAGGLGLSGTQGSLGGGLSGSFTSPAGVQSALNTTSGTTTGVSGLNGAGRFVPPRGLGSGTVSGAAVGTGSPAPVR